MLIISFVIAKHIKYNSKIVLFCCYLNKTTFRMMEE